METFDGFFDSDVHRQEVGLDRVERDFELLVLLCEEAAKLCNFGLELSDVDIGRRLHGELVGKEADTTNALLAGSIRFNTLRPGTSAPPPSIHWVRAITCCRS